MIDAQFKLQLQKPCTKLATCAKMRAVCCLNFAMAVRLEHSHSRTAAGSLLESGREQRWIWMVAFTCCVNVPMIPHAIEETLVQIHATGKAAFQVHCECMLCNGASRRLRFVQPRVAFYKESHRQPAGRSECDFLLVFKLALCTWCKHHIGCSLKPQKVFYRGFQWNHLE